MDFLVEMRWDGVKDDYVRKARFACVQVNGQEEEEEEEEEEEDEQYLKVVERRLVVCRTEVEDIGKEPRYLSNHIRRLRCICNQFLLAGCAVVVLESKVWSH